MALQRQMEKNPPVFSIMAERVQGVVNSVFYRKILSGLGNIIRTMDIFYV